MRVSESLACLAWLTTVSAFSGRHASHEGLLQIPPSFSRDGINMYPALHPEHDSKDIGHLVPHGSKQLYYSQEGHRPALHGAKHSQLHLNFSRPTVVLEHSSHIKEVNCYDEHIQVCFKTTEGLEAVEKSWMEYTDSKSFNLITYHIGCGHRTGESRSIFVASQPRIEGYCVTVVAELSDEQEEIREGTINWGTYQSPKAKRQPVKGHVKAAKADPEIDTPTLSDLSRNSGDSQANVDLTKNGTAVHDFFGTDSINTDIPDKYETGLDYISDENDQELAKRGLFSWIVEGILAVVKAVDQVVKTTVKAVDIAAQAVITAAVVTVKLFMVPFGVPFDQGYHADIEFDHRVGGGRIGTDIASNLGGTDSSFVLSSAGAAMQIECESCGAKANFSFGGELAFSVDKGISKAKVYFVNHEDFVFDAIYGVTVDAKAIKSVTTEKQDDAKATRSNTKEKEGITANVEEEIGTLPFASISIPKIITIGPKVSINSAASIYVDAHGEFRAGARFTIAEGEIVLDAISPDGNKASGFTPSLQPVFELKKGSITATADLSIPVGVEVGLNILSGTWKKSIGVFTAPSLYFTAGLSSGEDKKCNNGVELRVGAKNRVYSSTLGLWEYEFQSLSTTFYETGLGCISTAGWNASEVNPGTLFNEVADTFGGEQNLANNKTLNLTQPGPIIYEDEEIAKNKEKNKEKLRKLPKTNGFRLIQDASLSSTLVSGTDGRIYLVENKAEYDVSAPWGGMEVDKNIFSYDVFGRLIWFDRVPLMKSEHMVEVGVSAAQNMSPNAQAASFSLMKHDGLEYYGLSFKHPNSDAKTNEFWYPTVCKFPDQGLRLFATWYLVGEDGLARERDSPKKMIQSLQYDYELERTQYGVGDASDCVTVRLTSNQNSTVEATS
ncbi:unnamed protein product [Penicillium glandicola]